MPTHQYFAIYKPFGYLSQFSRELPEHQVLGDLYDFPKDVYSIGRLDRDSEGLLLLTNDKSLNDRLLNPKNKHWRTYWVQVENIPTPEAIQQLCKGVDIRINKRVHRTLPAKAKLFDASPPVLERMPPIRFRANVPTAWLSLQLQEGKNRQVRRMCAKVGFPVLRLIRYSIEDLTTDGLRIGEVRNLEQEILMRQLKLL
ncbi:MAG: pseudouridine synthase [Bacteroidota bacterium]